MAREFSKKFYKTKEWKKCREYIYNKYHGLCVQCSKPGQEVHHIVYLTPDNVNDTDITLGEDNLILLCKECHHKKHLKRDYTKDGFIFNDDGELVPIAPL